MRSCGASKIAPAPYFLEGVGAAQIRAATVHEGSGKGSKVGNSENIAAVRGMYLPGTTWVHVCPLYFY